MGQKKECIEQMESYISVEEFDNLTREHEFSKTYEKNKKQMLKEYRKSIYRPGRKRLVKAASFLLLCMIAPVMAGIAANSDFLYRIWGTEGREDIEPHEETLYDEVKESSCIVTYPKREYTDMNLDEAEELIGSAISYGPIVKEIGNSKLTIMEAAYDGKAAFVEFVLEGEEVISGIAYGQLDNESKGAWFLEDAPVRFLFSECNENIYVDLERSTEKTLYCYDYIVLPSKDQQVEGLTLEIHQEMGVEKNGEEEIEYLFIPLKEKMERKEYVNPEGGEIKISPIAMEIDMNTGLGLSKEEVYDPWHVYYAVIHYRDGSSYLIHEHEIEGIHFCENEIDNVSYTSQDTRNHLVFVFNRLVDIENVESIMINETIYQQSNS